jgi:2-polyprenyl-6-methoxyphenol hydroxylase-like FAD-dependent oxidoreductase
MPLGGFGMSAGIADAANLAWKLAGVLHGWATPEILDAYEAERQPITDQASRIISDIGYQDNSPMRSTWSSNAAAASTSATSTIDQRS